ncbi:hypothetical protein Murru_1541 [Allomuricauda ruestringensis DSM 13258]|uniref:Isoleucyl-tRNA synthetase n=1 Tax=Allomuricauda ruestringensis (strain DSM 13258 / CIP 107369 / LMG 19739 / B1) TaxID=886377 RepID=G2PQI7_ALLRU|nr:hypothetical protein [Allomuricauda ruestringensis]AEM70582.1 hypothetical protein Murru_1541 [Allomuricauda ruestringensis DSM 13258]
MKIKLKHIIFLIMIASFAAIFYGLSLDEDHPDAQKYVGGGTVGLFLVAMPLFLWKESQGKNMKDYMLTKENIKKMQEKERKKTKNQ